MKSLRSAPPSFYVRSNLDERVGLSILKQEYENFLFQSICLLLTSTEVKFYLDFNNQPWAPLTIPWRRMVLSKFFFTFGTNAWTDYMSYFHDCWLKIYILHVAAKECWFSVADGITIWTYIARGVKKEKTKSHLMADIKFVSLRISFFSFTSIK